jgi:3-hydroxyisobutyrate dehydrogenase
MNARVAVLGLGTMGAPMAGNLVRAGFLLTVWSRNPERARGLVAQGAAWAATAREAAGAAAFVLAMVSDDAASRAVWCGEQGALAGVRSGTVLIESSTVSPGWIAELASLAAERGAGFLDAPVLGSRPQAERAELLFLAGGDGQVLESARPVLAALGRSVHHLGPLGSGATMKLVSNLLIGVQAAALAEALVLAERAGLDPAQVAEVVTSGSAASPVVRALTPRMQAPDGVTYFALGLLRKDLDYALAEAERAGCALPVTRAVRALLGRAEAQGLAADDMSRVTDVVR